MESYNSISPVELDKEEKVGVKSSMIKHYMKVQHVTVLLPSTDLINGPLPI